MRISHKHKFVFLAIPRTGSTTLRQILDDYSDVKSVHIMNKDIDNPFYDHIPASELKLLFDERGWDWFGYKRFCVIRNPFDRVVSLYHHYKKINRDTSKAQTSLYNFAKYVYYRLRPELSFERYVMNIKPTNPLPTSLKNFICDEDGQFLVDDVLTFENLTLELPTYLAPLGIHLHEENIPHLNASNDRSKYVDYYTDKTRDRVTAMYEYEIERFGYTF